MLDGVDVSRRERRGAAAGGVGESGEEFSEKFGEEIEAVLVRVVKIDPYFNTVEGLDGFGRDESETVDMFCFVKVLSHQVEHQIPVQFILALNILVDWKYEATSCFVLGVLPLGFNALLEELDRIDSPPSVLGHLEAA